jgi:hypothetical protein
MPSGHPGIYTSRTDETVRESPNRRYWFGINPAGREDHNLGIACDLISEAGKLCLRAVQRWGSDQISNRLRSQLDERPVAGQALHQHPVPVFVYVLEGEVELRTEGGEAQRYGTGQSWIESQNRQHQAFNVAAVPSRLLVVFMGEEGQPLTIAAE